MSYFTRTHLEAEIPAADLVALLDDDHDGSEDSGVYAAVASRAEARIDAILAPRYPVPFADGAVPRPVQDAALMACCAALYRRRGTPDAENPFAVREASVLATLRECAAGTADLDAALDASGAVAVIPTESLNWALPNQEGLC